MHAGLLCLASAVTADGPREWLTVVRRHGQRAPQLHLLPDTDYLAWDALAGATPAPLDAAPMAAVSRGLRAPPALG